MTRRRAACASLILGLLGCDGEPTSTHADPGPLAQEVHERGEYPDEIEIADAPRWTMALAQRTGLSPAPLGGGGGGTIIVRPGRGGGGAQINGGAASGDSLVEGEPEEPSGGQVSDPEDGWDTDGWAEPEPAASEAIALGGVGDDPLSGADWEVVEAEPGDCEGGGPCPGGTVELAVSGSGSGELAVGGSSVSAGTMPGAGSVTGVQQGLAAGSAGEATAGASGSGAAGAGEFLTAESQQAQTNEEARTDEQDGTRESDEGTSESEGESESDEGTSESDGGTESESDEGTSESDGGTEEGDEGEEESESEGGDESESEGGTESDDGAEEEEDDSEVAATDEPRGPPSRWWLWLLAGVALTGVTELILRRLLRPKPGEVIVASSQAGESTTTEEPQAAPTETAVATAAPTIDYDAEIQSMLDRSLRMLGWQPAGTQLARTAREILRSVGFGDPRRVHAQEVVRVAEQVRFAGVPADSTLYERAKAAFDSLTAVVEPANQPLDRPSHQAHE